MEAFGNNPLVFHKHILVRVSLKREEEEEKVHAHTSKVKEGLNDTKFEEDLVLHKSKDTQ